MGGTCHHPRSERQTMRRTAPRTTRQHSRQLLYPRPSHELRIGRPEQTRVRNLKAQGGGVVTAGDSPTTARYRQEMCIDHRKRHVPPSPPITVPGLRRQARSCGQTGLRSSGVLLRGRVDRGSDFVRFEVRFRDRIQQRVNVFETGHCSPSRFVSVAGWLGLTQSRQCGCADGFFGKHRNDRRSLTVSACNAVDLGDLTRRTLLQKRRGRFGSSEGIVDHPRPRLNSRTLQIRLQTSSFEHRCGFREGHEQDLRGLWVLKSHQRCREVRVLPPIWRAISR